MLKKINSIINILMGSFIGIFIGTSISQYSRYKKHPELYAMQSAPWYLSIQLTGIALVILLIVSIVVKLMIRKKLQRGNAKHIY